MIPPKHPLFSMEEDDIMDEKTELLISLGAATAANCVPCFDYYFKSASAIGIPAEEVQKAVELACKIKTGAGIVMRNGIREITGKDWESDPSQDRNADHPCCK
jgi:alkylhydroperoxidase/carboxymuconolactone decarboxylase family protein YurZ